MSELLLGVNIDHIATLRNARGTNCPDPIQAAFIAEQAGADNITLHLREDRRHIKDRDIRILCKTIQTRMNLEMAVTEDMLNTACSLLPYSCCLVPEKRQELTTEGGLDLVNQYDKISQAVTRLNDAGINVSLFVDPNKLQIIKAAEIGASCIEIHTGTYANAKDDVSRTTALNEISQAVIYAVNLGLKVNAGHGLNYYNVRPIAALKSIQELNIGHAIISRSVISGLAKAVIDMKRLISEARN